MLHLRYLAPFVGDAPYAEAGFFGLVARAEAIANHLGKCILCTCLGFVRGYLGHNLYEPSSLLGEGFLGALRSSPGFFA